MSERILVRVGAAFLSSVLRAGLSFASGLMIARGLGASHYGDMAFLLGSFTASSHLLEMGTASAFYTLISRRRRSRTFFTLYLGWMALQFVVTALVVGLVLPAEAIHRIWVGHERSIVLLAFGASFFMTQLWGMVSQLGEALRKTAIVQAASVAQGVAHLALIGMAAVLGWLSVRTVFWLLLGEFLVTAAWVSPRLLREHLDTPTGRSEGGRAVFQDFAAYCRPLIVYSWVGFLYAFADRWLLQQFGGSTQQGFFAVAQQFANISLLATTSILMVFWKEIAEAQERRDEERVRMLYRLVSRSFFCVGACASCALIPYGRELLAGLLGSTYEAGWLCLALMLLFPIHQSLGQIQGSYFYASGQTGTYTKIGLLMMIVSLPATYFVLAPRTAVIPGLGLGAVGLAIKLVVLQLIGVNLQGVIVARTNGWAGDVRYQITTILCLFALGWGCKWASALLLGVVWPAGSPVAVGLIGGVLYAGCALLLVSRIPGLAGLTRDELRWVRDGLAGWGRSLATASAPGR